MAPASLQTPGRALRSCPTWAAGLQARGTAVKLGAPGARCWATGASRRRHVAAAAAGPGDGEQPANFGPDADPSEPSSGMTIPDALPVFSEGSDWRAVRAQLVASARAAEGGEAPPTADDQPWAHRLPRPEQGCLLLANPVMFMNAQQYFWMSVILVCEHSERGSWGLILNRPTEYRIGDLEGVQGLRPEFDGCQLWLGGDVGPEATHLLHGQPGLAASMEVLPNVFLGGFQAAREGLAAGRLAADDFKVLTRHAGWGPGQLEAEVRRGVWIPVSASSDAVLARGLAAAPGEAPSAGNVAAMWHWVAKLAGGDLAQLASAVEGETDPEIARAAAGGGRQQGEQQQQQQQQEQEQEQEEQPGEQGDSSRPAGGSPQQEETEEAAGDCADGSGAAQTGGRSDPSQLHRTQQARWQQHRRRTRLPEGDYRDGAGI